MSTLYCLGDSLTFGPGVRPAQKWTALAASKGLQITNLGVPGDTAVGMLARLQKLEFAAGDAVLLLGGTNDIFCTLSDATARSAMAAMVQQLLAKGVRPLVAIPIPVVPDMAPEKWRQLVDFPATVPVLAGYRVWLQAYCHTFRVPIVDFYKDYVNQDGTPRRELYLDGLHPNALGHQTMADRLLEELA